MRRIFICVITIATIALWTAYTQADDAPSNRNHEKPKIALSFDDGSTNDMPNYALEEWNQQLLNNLKNHNLKAMLFATGGRLQGAKGAYVLASWDDDGHIIANHTFTHPNFHNPNITLDDFQRELVQNDSVINRYENYSRLFRFPYLKEGNTSEKVHGFRNFLKRQNYKNGHVTIDASDWYINGRLIRRLKEDPNADISGYRQFYIEHLYDRAMYYDSLSSALVNRKISHTLLLHHNLAAALFLDDLIRFFKDNGWEVIDADAAYADEIYQREPQNIPAGESLIWALAKQSGDFDDVLRYPAEDGAYEKSAMDRLGL